ncbi:hypothetical protein [Flavobacterium silvaticum]|uniref:Lipoprotein n=1 Tax=Flavobacterium silvaticum TaxID=1852020 RepID=A0A972FIR0_9FLAO|nr:hypothetical protein [Flavobacterium silvaticum]NMH26508.1 hypothetical protein [Flavobacterium silvaticum]
MKILKIILLSLLISTVSACMQKENSKANAGKQKTVDKDDFHIDNYNISMIRLIANPEEYHGKEIRVQGYLNLQFEGDAIYLHEDDYKNAIFKNSFWVEFSNEVLTQNPTDGINNQYVTIVGTFDMNSRGHMGVFAGTIKNITEIYSRNIDEK